MAINGEQILILVGDGEASETFTHPCLINTDRGIDFSADVNQTVVPNCDDQSATAWKESDKDGLSATISGAGVLDLDSVELFFDWLRSPYPKNVQANVGGAGGSTFAGAYHCTAFNITGTRKQKATCSITLVSDGEVTRVNN